MLDFKLHHVFGSQSYIFILSTINKTLHLMIQLNGNKTGMQNNGYFIPNIDKAMIALRIIFSTSCLVYTSTGIGTAGLGHAVVYCSSSSF